jgi:hypothetical protein
MRKYKDPEDQKVQDTIDSMTAAFSRGDLEGIMRTYEPGAIVVGEPGKTEAGSGTACIIRALHLRAAALHVLRPRCRARE